MKLQPEEIKQIRTDRSWTQADMAVVLGVSSNTVSQWETGVEPRGTAPKLLRLIKEDRIIGDLSL